MEYDQISINDIQLVLKTPQMKLNIKDCILNWALFQNKLDNNFINQLMQHFIQPENTQKSKFQKIILKHVDLSEFQVDITRINQFFDESNSFLLLSKILQTVHPNINIILKLHLNESPQTSNVIVSNSTVIFLFDQPLLQFLFKYVEEKDLYILFQDVHTLKTPSLRKIMIFESIIQSFQERGNDSMAADVIDMLNRFQSDLEKMQIE